MVNSERIPPRRVSAWQSAIRPILAGTLFATRLSSQASAPAPVTSCLVKGVRSIMPTRSPDAQRLIPDMRKIIGAAETPLILCLNAGRGKPIGPFPAVALPENRPHSLELVVDRTGFCRAGIRPFLIREVNDEHVAIGLFVFLDHVALARVGTVAAGIDRHHVDARLTLDDPFRQLPAGAARRGDAEAVPLVEP